MQCKSAEHAGRINHYCYCYQHPLFWHAYVCTNDPCNIHNCLHIWNNNGIPYQDGPAASVLGIEALGAPQVKSISLDVGGTTTDIAFWENGLPLLARHTVKRIWVVVVAKHFLSQAEKNILFTTAHSLINASQFIRRRLYFSWYKQVPNHCLL